MSNMKEIDSKFIEFYKQFGAMQGIKDSMLCEILARIYIDPDDVAMDRLAKETGYSLASISNKVKFLEMTGFLERKTKPGTRKVYLSMDKNLLMKIKDATIKKHDSINKTIIMLPEIIKEYKPKAKTQRDKEKINIIENYHSQMIQFMDVLKNMINNFEEIENKKC